MHHVTYQYNADGNINFGDVQNKMEVTSQLEHLLAEVAKAIEAGDIKAAMKVLSAFLKLEFARVTDFLREQWRQVGPELQATFETLAKAFTFSFTDVRSTIFEI